MTTSVSSLLGSTDGSSTDSTTDSGSSDGDSDLRDAAEALAELQDTYSADEIVENVEAYIDDNGSRDDVVAYLERLASDEELRRNQVEYRRLSDINRIRKSFLYNVDGDFSIWSANFYYGGPERKQNDNPSDDSYNGVQQASREEVDGNLIWYKAAFPEPVAEWWDSEPVLYTEMPDHDSHIYVSREWFEEFRDFTFEADGETLVRPPTDEELEALADEADGSTGSGAADAPFKPGTFNVPDLRDALGDSPGEDYTVAELEALLETEQNGDDRKTAKKAIRGALNQARDAQEGQQTLDEAADDGDADDLMAKAGRIIAENDLDDANPAAVAGMLEGGMDEERIVAIVS